MDSEHRHELKQNDLREFLENFGAFWEKHGTWILTVVAVVVVIWAGSTWWSNRQMQVRSSAWTALDGAASAPELDGVALDHSQPIVRALARLRAGDLYLDQAVHPQRDLLSDDDVRQALDRAEQRYRDVLSLNVPPIYRANALLGLAAVAENRSQWDQAAASYELVMGMDIPSLAAMARARKQMLPALARPVVFAASEQALPTDQPFDDLRLDFSAPLDPGLGGGAPVLTVPED